MNMPIDFEAIYSSPLRWPQTRDKLVRVPEDRARNTSIAQDTNLRGGLMTEGYRKGADLMVECALISAVNRDILVYPVIFCYRQFVELSLKHLLANYGPSFGAKPNWEDHRLDKLWVEFKKILEHVGFCGEDDEVVQNIVSEFGKIDPGSFTFRFPVTKKANPVPMTLSELDLGELRDVVGRVAAYLIGCDCYFSELKNV